MTTQTHNPQIFPNNNNADIISLFEQDSFESKGIRQARKYYEYLPEPFPIGDERWKEMFDIKKYNKQIDIYHSDTGRQVYIIARRDFINKEGNYDKQITPISYCGFRNNFVNKQLYSNHSYLYDCHKFPCFDQSAIRELLWVEGEKTCRAAAKLFPNLFVTTASGGIQSINKIGDLSVLRDFRSITFWADAEKEGQDAFLEFAQFVQDQFPKIEIKVVDLPSTLPIGWDLADDIPPGVDIYQLLREATPVNEYDNYQNLRRDIQMGRWKYLKLNNCYYDIITGDELPEKNLNSLYLRDTNRQGGNAHREIQSRGAEVVTGYIFHQSKDLIVKHEGKKYINSRKPVHFDVLTREEIAELQNDPEIKFMLNHFYRAVNQDEFLYKHILSTIAHDFQYPNINRIWATLFCSTQGWGKTWIGHLLTHFNGWKNTKWLEQEEIYDRYRDWIPTCNMVIIDELRWEKVNQAKFVSKIKTLITSDSHRTEAKYKNPVDFIGHYKFWVFSNDFIPFEIDEEERRWHIIHIEEKKSELLNDMGKDYFNKLWKLLYLNSETREPNLEFITKAYNFFMNYKIDYGVFDVNNAPETLAKKEIKSASITQDEADLNELLLQGEYPFDRLIVCVEHIMDRVRTLKETHSYYRSMFRNLTNTDISTWLRKRKTKKVNRGQVIQLGSDPIRRNYHDLSEDHRFAKCMDNSILREHMKGQKKNSNANILQFEDKKNDDQSKAEGTYDIPF